MTQGTPIGLPMQSLFATSSVLYGVKQSDRRIYQYQGSATNEWKQIGEPATQFATNWYHLFRLDSNGDVSMFQGTTGEEANQWLKIGEQLSSLIAGGPALYATNSANGNILRYEGFPFGWTEIGGPGYQFVTNGKHLFGISPNQQQVWQYMDTPPGWNLVGGAVDQLYIAGNALYAIAEDGNTLLRYQGPNVWLEVGQGWAKFASLDLSLYAISKDSSIVGQFDGTPGSWTQFAGYASAIAADFRSLYITNGEGVFEYDIVIDEDGGGGVEGEAASDLQTRALATTSSDWIWSFKTSNSYFSGYDGEIELSLFWSGVFQQSLKLPRKHFERGKNYFMELDITAGAPPLRGISLGGEENFFDDQWKVASATAYDPSTFNLYKFSIDQKVPNSGTIFIAPSSVNQVHTPPSGYVTVYVWNYLGKDVAWGHTSLELSDGTYISWWPQGYNRQRMPLIPQVYTVDAFPNQTYANDVSFEDNHPPDWRMLIGGLNESEIRSWWGGFKTSHQWSTLSQNCSTTVADALWAGGASGILTSRETDNFQSIALWTPNNVLAFAQALIEHGN